MNSFERKKLCKWKLCSENGFLWKKEILQMEAVFHKWIPSEERNSENGCCDPRMDSIEERNYSNGSCIPHMDSFGRKKLFKLKLCSAKYTPIIKKQIIDLIHKITRRKISCNCTFLCCKWWNEWYQLENVFFSCKTLYSAHVQYMQEMLIAKYCRQIFCELGFYWAFTSS